jgi:hypothetical protein
MALNIAMNGDDPAQPAVRKAPAAASSDEHRSRLEVILACAGFVGWLFSAYEGLLVVLK